MSASTQPSAHTSPRQQTATVAFAGVSQSLPDGKKRRIDPAAVSAKQLQRRRDIARLKQIRGSLEELILLVEAQDRLPRTQHGHLPTRGAVRVEAIQLLNQLRGVLDVSPATQNAKPTTPKAAPVAARKVVTPKPTEPSAKVPSPAANLTSLAAASESARIQLRLSKALVRILVEFSKAGQSPNRITERSLWKDPGICDAATILGITPPQLKKIVSRKAKQSA